MSGYLGTAALVVALSVACGSPGPDGPRFPEVVAAIGDSITQAANPNRDELGLSNPEHSWATGDDPDDGVESHYERILEEDPDAEAHNVAVSGATMSDAPAQADEAVAAGAGYVTVLMGANDVCASSVDAMTVVDDYEASFREAMDRLVDGLPEARVYVLSVPDVLRLRELFGDSQAARLVWRSFGICRAALGEDADRDAVRRRNVAYNEVLEDVCGSSVGCRYDEGAVFETTFERGDVSSADFFHPSLGGQAKLAEVAWEHGYWAGR